LMISENFNAWQSVYYCVIHIDRSVSGNPIYNILSIENILNNMLLLLIFRNSYKYNSKNSIFTSLLLLTTATFLSVSAAMAFLLFLESFSFYEIQKPKKQNQNTKWISNIVDFIFVALYLMSLYHYFNLPEKTDPKIFEDNFPASFKIILAIYCLLVPFMKLENDEKRINSGLKLLSVGSLVIVALFRWLLYEYGQKHNFKTIPSLLHAVWLTSMNYPLIAASFHNTIGSIFVSIAFILLARTRNASLLFRLICSVFVIIFGSPFALSFFLLSTNRVFHVPQNKPKTE